MRIASLHVENLRCIEMLDIRLFDYTSLIGPNNAGKSTVLRALELLLSQTPPDRDEWSHGREAHPIIIEAVFTDLEQWERDKPGVASLVYNDQLRIRMVATHPPEGEKPKDHMAFEAFKRAEQIDGWNDAWGQLSDEIREEAVGLGLTGTAFRNAANKERLRQHLRDNRPQLITLGDEAWTAEGISIPQAMQQAFPYVQMVPAVRDAVQDAKPVSTTSFGVLLKQIVLPAVVESDEYLALLEAVRVLEARLRGADGTVLQPIKQLTDQLNARLGTLIKAEVQIGMEPPDAEKFVGSNTTLRLGDGLPTRIELQGHGLQRALVFAMLELLASRMCAPEDEDEEHQGRSVVLLFEEPELFIHPHLMRRLRDVLSTIARNGRWQVVVTTHSPFLVSIGDEPQSLVIHRRAAPDAPPTVKQLEEDPFSDRTMREEKERLNALLRFHPTVCEAFFAQRVVLVEGDSEVAILTCEPRVLEQAGVDPEAAREITLVSCAGKWTIVPIARLLRLFGVPLRVMHDLDLKGLVAEKIESPVHPYKANAAIEAAVGDSGAIRKNIDALEHVLWDGVDVPSSSDDKPIRALRRVRELCDADNELQDAPMLKELVQFVFTW